MNNPSLEPTEPDEKTVNLVQNVFQEASAALIDVVIEYAMVPARLDYLLTHLEIETEGDIETQLRRLHQYTNQQDDADIAMKIRRQLWKAIQSVERRQRESSLEEIDTERRERFRSVTDVPDASMRLPSPLPVEPPKRSVATATRSSGNIQTPPESKSPGWVTTSTYQGPDRRKSKSDRRESPYDRRGPNEGAWGEQRSGDERRRSRGRRKTD